MAFDATIKDYLKQIDEAPLLSWDDEKELAGAPGPEPTLLPPATSSKRATSG